MSMDKVIGGTCRDAIEQRLEAAQRRTLSGFVGAIDDMQRGAAAFKIEEMIGKGTESGKIESAQSQQSLLSVMSKRLTSSSFTSSRISPSC